MNNYYTPKEVMKLNIESGEMKAKLPIYKMIILGILAGAYIGIGAEASNLAMHNISNVGIARTLAGAIFTAGLMMIVIAGGELFTGNCLMITTVLDKKAAYHQMIYNLVIVYLSNLIGGMLVALAVNYCGQLDYSNNALGAFTIKVAVGKAGLSFGVAIVSGILCNVLVCIAVLMGTAARDIAGKCIGMFFPIWVFVISGFEHCVANMYYFSAGIIAAQNNEYVAKAKELYSITDKQINSLNIKTMFLSNLLPVTIGNLIGGVIVVGIGYYMVYGKTEGYVEESVIKNSMYKNVIK